MRRIRYRVAMSLDGYIAGPQGEIDWIVADPEIDFGAIMKEFDTILVGRRTFDQMVQARRTTMPGMRTVVFSRELRQADHPEVTVVNQGQNEMLDSLRSQPGKDIWLFGGSTLFRGLLEAGMVDGVEVSIMPVVLGGGVPLTRADQQGLGPRGRLELKAQRIYKTGIVSLEYAAK
jgi:dihydrofolate reductase